MLLFLSFASLANLMFNSFNKFVINNQENNRLIRFEAGRLILEQVNTNGEIEFVDEINLEFICDVKIVKKVIQVIRQIHPYEEPAIDIVPVLDESMF